MLALIGNLDTAELVIVVFAAILVFGRKLPQVAAQAGSQLVKLRRSLDQAWRDTGMDNEIGKVRRDFESAIPRDLSLGEMAKIASAEMDKRIRANEEDLAKEESRAPTPAPAASTPAPTPDENEPSRVETSPAPKVPPSPPWESSGDAQP